MMAAFSGASFSQAVFSVNAFDFGALFAEVIGVGGPQVTNIFLFSGVTEPPFAVQRRTS